MSQTASECGIWSDHLARWPDHLYPVMMVDTSSGFPSTAATAPNDGAPVVRVDGARSLAELLREQVLDGRIAFGSVLPSERELAKQTGSGRSTVREALKVLHGEGLIGISDSGKRVVVQRPTTEPMRRVFETFVHGHAINLGSLIQARLIIEPEAAALAARRSSPLLLGMLYSATARHEAAENVDASLAFHASWHVAIAEAAGNVVLSSIVDSLTGISYRGTQSLYERTDEHMNSVIRSHRKIIDAIAASDPNAARQAMTTHLKAYERQAAALDILDRPVPIDF